MFTNQCNVELNIEQMVRRVFDQAIERSLNNRLAISYFLSKVKAFSCKTIERQLNSAEKLRLSTEEDDEEEEDNFEMSLPMVPI